MSERATQDAKASTAAELDALEVAQLTGDIPQNVNFGISALATRAELYPKVGDGMR